MLDDTQMQQLFEEAKRAAAQTYSPYSSFPVGAAVLTSTGKVFPGANVENVSYGLTICAERVAVCKSITEGHRDMVAIAIFSPKIDLTPCGACRQFIREFGDGILIICQREERLHAVTISELLPDAFAQRHLH